MDKIREELGNVDIGQLREESIIVKTIKNTLEFKDLDTQYAIKCNELEETFTPEQNESFCKFERFLESLSPNQREQLYELGRLKEKMLDPKFSQIIDYISNYS